MSEEILFDKYVYDILISELGVEDVLEVLAAFLADSADKIQSMAANVSDRPTTRREAHALKSSAATFGFSELSRLARELERGAESMSAEQLHQSIAAVQQAFAATERFAQTRLLASGAEAA